MIGRMDALVPRTALLLAIVLVLGSVRPARSEVAAGDWEPIGPGEIVGTLFAPTSGALFAQLALGGERAGRPRANGLVRSDDGGTTWTTVALPPPHTIGPNQLRYELPWERIAIDPTDQTIIYAPGAEGLYKSEGDATGWHLILPTDLTVRALAVSPADARLVYLALLGPIESPGTGMRFLRSQDGGATWDRLQDEPSRPYGCAWDVALLQPHPSDADRVFRTAECNTGKDNVHRLEMSADRGATWARVLPTYTNGIPDQRWVGQPERVVGGAGPVPRRFYVAVSGAHSPGTASGIFPRGLFRTDDDGTSWVRIPPANPDLWSSTSLPYSSRSLAVDPSNPDRVYAGLTGSGVKVSSDGGITWADLGRQDLPAIRDLVLGVDGQNLFAATDQGVYRLHLSSEPTEPPTP